MLRTFALALALIVLASTPALAQRAPDMATLDRGDGISKLGVDVGFTSLRDPPYDAALRLELYGQFLTRSGFGLYGAFPVTRSFGGEGEPQPPDGPEAYNRTSLSDLDAGMLYVIESGILSWVFRAGIALPTSTDGRDPFLTRYYGSAPRMTDLALAAGDWHVRLSISPLIHVDRLFVRADIGFDIDAGSDDYHYLRLNLGAGVDLGPLALSLELANTGTFGDLDREEDFFHTVAFTLRFMGKQLQPFLSVGSPIDDYRRDDVAFFLAGGLQVAF
jgi:hypothetical protein